MGLRVVLKRRSLRMEEMRFVGSKLMILADFVLIMKGVRLGNIVFHFCGVGRRLECCMSNRGKLFCLILFAGLQQVRLLQFELES